MAASIFHVCIPQSADYNFEIIFPCFCTILSFGLGFLLYPIFGLTTTGTHGATCKNGSRRGKKVSLANTKTIHRLVQWTLIFYIHLSNERWQKFGYERVSDRVRASERRKKKNETAERLVEWKNVFEHRLSDAVVLFFFVVSLCFGRCMNIRSASVAFDFPTAGCGCWWWCTCTEHSRTDIIQSVGALGALSSSRVISLPICMH